MQYALQISAVNCYAGFTHSLNALIETFGGMWMRWGMHECRHSHSCARTMRQSWNIHISFDSGLIYDVLPRALRQDTNWSRTWQTRQMYHSHSHSRLISCCLDKNVNTALLYLQYTSPNVPTQARSGDPGQGGAVSVGPICHACIAIHPAKHRTSPNKEVIALWNIVVCVEH